MHHGRLGQITYRGVPRANRLTQGIKQELFGLSECTGDRAVLWFGPEKMALRTRSFAQLIVMCKYFSWISSGAWFTI